MIIFINYKTKLKANYSDKNIKKVNDQKQPLNDIFIYLKGKRIAFPIIKKLPL